jgi:hypothetical protein
MSVWTGEHLSPYPKRSATQVEIEWMLHCDDSLLALYNLGYNLYLHVDGNICRRPANECKDNVAKLKKGEVYREGYEIPLNWDERTRMENIRVACQKAKDDPRQVKVNALYLQQYNLEVAMKTAEGEQYDVLKAEMK